MKKLTLVLTALLLLSTACTRKTNALYLQEAQTALENYNLAVEALDARIEMYEADPTLLLDATWAADTLQVLADLQAAGDTFRDLPEASSDLAALDSLLQSVADETDQYVETVTTAINTLDENLVETARSHRETIGDFIDDAQIELIRSLGSD